MSIKLVKQNISAVIYGGNGFVGTHIAQQLQQLGVNTVCASRSGHRPAYLQDRKWSESVRWCHGDASNPDIELLASSDVMICAIGSPPVPTFSKSAYEQQVFMNGTSCANAIDAAAQAGVKRIILLGAQIPWLLNTKKFGYTKGKKIALDAARRFADISEEHSAIVLQPGAIYGRRHLSNGQVVRLDWFMAPLSKIMPWQFVSVQNVAQRIAHAVTQPQPYAGKLCIIKNRNIPIS